MNRTDKRPAPALSTTVQTGERWWVDEYTAVPDPIEEDTDYCFDTAGEALEHGTPWTVFENPAANDGVPISPGLYITDGDRDGAAYYLASSEPVRDEDRGTWFLFY